MNYELCLDQQSCVISGTHDSLIYKDKLQDNYSIFNEFLMNYTQIIMARGSVVKGLSKMSKILKFLIFANKVDPFCMWGPQGGTRTIATWNASQLPNFNIHRWHCGPCFL